MRNLPVQVYIVDDESSVCTAYARLVRSAKMQPRTFESVEEFMHADLSDENACVISDVRMPGTSGLELPALLTRAGRHLPVIFVTAHDTPETRDIAQRAGAAAYFRKPVDDQALLDAVAWALSGQSDNPSP
jgi:FixJ family two-component response regulator